MIKNKSGRYTKLSDQNKGFKEVKMSTSWFVATMIMKCRIENDPMNPVTCFEQIHLIKAENGYLAYEKALQLGKANEHSYKNNEGNTVHWEFVGLENLEELLDELLQDGSEIRSRLLLVDDPQRLVRAKEGLTIFISEKIGSKTAREILSYDDGT